MDNKFLHRDVTRIFPHIKPRTLISWSERGLIVPEFGDASGRGSARAYSYRNLIEIAIISEMLAYGLPFSVIRGVVTSEKMKRLLAEQKFDVVYFYTRELVAADLPREVMDKEPPWVSQDGFLSHQEFLDRGGKAIFFAFEKDGSLCTANITSAFVLNFQSVKRFVDGRLKRIGKN